MDLEYLLKNKELDKIQDLMTEKTVGYQVYNPFTLPISAKKGGLVDKKYIDLKYKKEDFEGKTVSDLGCCLGFFTFYSSYLGSLTSIGYDNNPDYIDFDIKISTNYTELYPEFKNRIKFEKIDLLSLPSIKKTDIILTHSILHWFIISNKNMILKQILQWLYDCCNYAVYFEGCVDANDPTMKRYVIPVDRYNIDLFIKESKNIFSKVEIIGNMSYCPTRIEARLFK